MSSCPLSTPALSTPPPPLVHKRTSTLSSPGARPGKRCMLQKRQREVRSCYQWAHGRRSCSFFVYLSTRAAIGDHSLYNSELQVRKGYVFFRRTEPWDCPASGGGLLFTAENLL